MVSEAHDEMKRAFINAHSNATFSPEAETREDAPPRHVRWCNLVRHWAGQIKAQPSRANKHARGGQKSTIT